jgi:radical SAM superfamily enzyme YgiQ (UPF0313 family)
MRVLLLNPKFPYSFWSFDRVCEMIGCKTLFPPLGLITVAALLPAAWEIRLKDLNAESVGEADWEWADLVMMTGMLIQRQNLLDLIREAKQRQKKIVVGGCYPSAAPEEVLAAGADVVVQGEAEGIIPQLQAVLEQEETGVVLKLTGWPALTQSPCPRFDLLKLDYYDNISVQTSRGCPYDCEFCDVVKFYGPKPRFKSPDQFLAELQLLSQLGWRRNVFICDDNFIGGRTHALAILHRLIPWMKQHGEPFGFWTQTSVNLGKDPQMIDLMTEGNFGDVFVGVETIEASVLEGSRKYHNKVDSMSQWLNTVQANGLGVMASFIIGLDHEPPGIGTQICRFVEENDLPLVMLNVLQAPPGTRLWDRLEKAGRLRQNVEVGKFPDQELNFVPSRPEADILAEWRQAVDYLYEPRRYLARALRFILKIRPTRRALAEREGRATAALKPPKSPRVKPWQDVLILIRLIWRQGIAADVRRQFWRQLWEVYRRNPSRMKKYLGLCVRGEHFFSLRDRIRQQPSNPG